MDLKKRNREETLPYGPKKTKNRTRGNGLFHEGEKKKLNSRRGGGGGPLAKTTSSTFGQGENVVVVSVFRRDKNKQTKKYEGALRVIPE